MNNLRVLIAAFASVVVSACAPPSDRPASLVAAPAVDHLASNRQLMLALTIPASDVLFEAGVTPPADTADWDRIAANAAMLGESGNLMLSGPRAFPQPEWSRYARALTALSRKSVEAANRRDLDSVLAAAEDILVVCESCHEKFMPTKAAETPLPEPDKR